MTASNPTSSETPLIIWAVSDGRAGIEAQVVGLANAVARKRPARIIVKRVGWKSWIGRLPWWLTPFPRQLLTPQSDIAPVAKRKHRDRWTLCIRGNRHWPGN